MEFIEILSLICSISGALLFLIAIRYELRIIKQLGKVKNPQAWKFATFFTAFFLLGYLINIFSILFELTDIRDIFNALVFLFGAIFLLLVIIISHKTYTVIFQAVEEDTKEDLVLDLKK